MSPQVSDDDHTSRLPRPPTGDSLEARIESLERTAARQRRVLLGLAAVAAVLFLAALAPGQRVVEAQAFTVRDDTGTPRAVLGLGEGGPSLSLYDAEGILRAALAIDGEGPILNLFGASGEPRAVVAERGQRSFLILRDVAGVPRAAMAVQESGEPSLYLLDETLEPIWRQPAQR